MWLLEFLFFAMTLLIGWMLFGYLLVLWFIGLLHGTKTPAFPDSWPLMSVVVPCYNEEEQILAKLEDVRSLDYPRDRLEVVFADGGSSDRTAELLATAIEPDEPFSLIRCPGSGKINQLNHVLPQLRGDIVVNTDADSRLSADALRWIAAEFAVASDVWVVGAYCRPEGALKVEQYYWDSQNKGRFLETEARTSSIVVAQCYAFRRELVKAFPEDVVADDIYVAFLAHSLGFRAVYSRYATAIETRGPKNHAEFLRHKFRKGNAFLRESLRFIYRLPEMEFFCKTMLITRTAQQLLLPWAALWWVLLAGVLLTLFRYDVVAFGAAFLVLLLIVANRVVAQVKLPEGSRRHSILTIVRGYLFMNAVVLITGLTYPFFRQGSSYARLTGVTYEGDTPERSQEW